MNVRQQILEFYKKPQSLLCFFMLFVGIYIVFFKYREPKSIIYWLILLVIFYFLWNDPDKKGWFMIFGVLVVNMVIIENLVIMYTGSLTYNYENIFYLVPHWLPIAYFNSVLFIALHYRLYILFGKK
jgi:hypothetical protein